MSDMFCSAVRGLVIIQLVFAAESEVMKVKPEQNVRLLCPTDVSGSITLLEWKRRDPPDKEDVYVFFFRNERSYDDYQHPGYRGRVQPGRPETEDGGVSIVLRNVGVNDTGTYGCRVVISQTGRNGTTYSDFKHQIHLVVADTSHPTGNEEGNRQSINLPSVTTVVVVVVFVVVVVAICGVFWKTKKQKIILHTNSRLNIEASV